MKVSVIVPVYRVEAYLKECIDSILNQDFSDYEVLLIDDGSPDRCGDICEEYAQQNACVRVFHQENKGLSAARNLGMEMAEGEWLTFVDSDDWLEKDALKVLYQRAVETQCDIVCAFYYSNYLDRQIRAWPEGIGEKTYHARENRQFLFECATYRTEPKKEAWLCTAWGKLYRAEFLREHKIIFPVGLRSEDLLFSLHVACHVERLHLTDIPVYHYRMRQSSIINTASFEGDKRIYAAVHAFMEEHQVIGEIQPYYYCIIVMGVLRNSRLRRKNISDRFTFRAAVQELKEYADLPEYREAFEKADLKASPIKTKFFLFLLRQRMYRTLVAVSVIYEKFLKKKKCYWK